MRAATPNIIGTCSKQAGAEWERRPTAEWPADCGPRSTICALALDWACSPGGDESIGVALTAAAVPLWIHLSLLDERRSRTEQAVVSHQGSDVPGRPGIAKTVAVNDASARAVD